MLVTATVVAPIGVSLDLPDDLPIGEIRCRVLEQARWLAENNGLCFEIIECNLSIFGSDGTCRLVGLQQSADSDMSSACKVLQSESYIGILDEL